MEKLDANNRNQLDECENKTSSKINLTLNKGNLKLDSKSEMSNNMDVSSNFVNLTQQVIESTSLGITRFESTASIKPNNDNLLHGNVPLSLHPKPISALVKNIPKLSPNISQRTRMTEVERLKSNINGMLGWNAEELSASKIRRCRQNKNIDYCYINTVGSSKPSTIKQLDDQTVQKCTKNTILHKTIKPTLKNNKYVKNLNIRKKKMKLALGKKSELSNVSDNNKEETMHVKTLNGLTSEDFKDYLYCQTDDIKLKCKLCSYNNVGPKIVRHYKEKHSLEEMLPSRICVNSAELLINESLREDYGLLNAQDLMSFRVDTFVNTPYTCAFCESMFYDITCFYDHITRHTGEYRYKCKMCKMTYPNVLRLEKHISKHSNYDKSEGIYHSLHSNPVGSNIIFGYICPFCYYIQLDYKRIVNHIIAWHIDEDDKFNGYWTIIRVNMSIGEDTYENAMVDYTKYVGCLPPILNDKVILKDVNQKYQTPQETIVSTSVKQKQKAMNGAESSVTPLHNEDNVNLPKSNIHHSALVDKIPSNVDKEKGQNSPHIDTVQSKEPGPIMVHSRLRVRNDLFLTVDKTKQQMPENIMTKLATKDTNSNND